MIRISRWYSKKEQNNDINIQLMLEINKEFKFQNLLQFIFQKRIGLFFKKKKLYINKYQYTSNIY